MESDAESNASPDVCTCPSALTELPMRIIARKEMEDPTSTKSITDVLDPNLASDLSDSAEPRIEESITEAVSARRQKLRKEMEEPHAAKLVRLSFEPNEALLRREREDPSDMQSKIERLEPILTRRLTLTELPNEAESRIDMEPEARQKERKLQELARVEACTTESA